MATRILVALFFVPILFVVLVYLPPVFLTIMVAGIAAIGSAELLRATKAASSRWMYLCTALAAILIPVSCWQGLGSWAPQLISQALLCVLFLMAILAYGREGAIRVESILFCLLGGVLIPQFLSALIRLRMMENGACLVLMPVVVAFLTDIGAYFAGVFLGKHRGVTRVSPNKSLEGFVGGLLSGMVFMLAYALILKHGVGLEVCLPNMALYGVVGSLVTELGDLSFSLIKRQFGIKDYGNLLPGHGGMLDRFDSMIFAAPAVWVMVTLFPAL